MRIHAGFTMLEMTLALAMVAILTTGVAGFFLMESRVWQAVSQRQDSAVKLMDTYFLMAKRLRDAKASDLTTSTATRVESAGKVVFRFVPAKQRLEWQGMPVLENVLATFSYSGIGGWEVDATGWAVNHASGVIRVELLTTGDLQSQVNFLVHPRRRN